MLSSQKSSLLQTSMSSSTALFRSAGSLPRRSRPYRQIRGLRLGLWYSYLEPSRQTELRRQYRELKRASTKTIADLDVTWNKLQKDGIGFHLGGRKAFMCSAWRGEDRSRGRRPQSEEASQSTIKTSNGIEDVEQSALDNILRASSQNMRGMGDLLRAREMIRSRSSIFRKIMHDGFSTRSPAYIPEKSTWRRRKGRSLDENFEAVGEIDPITNRRVYKNPSGGPKGSSPSPAPGKSTSSVTKLVSPDAKAESDLTREYLKDFAGNDHMPVYGYEPDGQKPEVPDPVQQGLSYYDAITKYGVAEENPGPNIIDESCPVKEGLADYDDVTKYGVAEENPGPNDTIAPCPVKEGLSEFDAVTQYGVAEENPGSSTASQRFSVEKGLSDFDAVTKYGVAEESQDRSNAQPIFDFLKMNSGKQRKNEREKMARQNLGAEDEGWLEYDSKISYDAPDFDTSPIRKETEVQRLSRRQKLEDDFQKSQDLETMDPTEFRRQLAKNRQQPTVPSKDPRRNLTGNYGRDFPEESKVKWEAEKDASGHTTLRLNTNARRQELFDSFKTDTEERTEEFVKPQHMIFSRNLEGSTNRMQPALDRMSKPEGATANSEKAEASDTKTNAMLENGMMGGETQDAAESSIPKPISKTTEPGDTLNSWRNESLSSDLYSKTPQGLETSYNEERKFENEKDPYSKKPQGLETSFTEEQLRRNKQAKRDQHRDFVREIRAIYEEKYGAINNAHRQAPKATLSENSSSEITVETQPVEEATLYKILAYDPTMQSINTAETTSIVPDSASPLTPAEVLLRMSNPAKFFPHFAPLQAQGYEILSGSGDVLVFRKVRAAGSAPAVKSSEEISEYQDRTRQTTNPIDGMRPIAATGNFASPTGFVNYDVAEPAFKSNIDVRREEPVFSGKSKWSEYESKKKPGLGKRVLFGGAVFGGVSYAIGVVADYFKTGGSDGRGPQGF